MCNGTGSQLMSASFLRDSALLTRTTTERMWSRTLPDCNAASSNSSRERSSVVMSCIILHPNSSFFNSYLLMHLYETARIYCIYVRRNLRLRGECPDYAGRTGPSHSGALRCGRVWQPGAMEK